MESNNKSKYLSLNQLSHEILIPKNWYIEDFSSSFYMPFHIHPQLEIMYCAKGSFNLNYKTDPNSIEYQSITVNENMFALVNVKGYHQIDINSDDTQIYNLEFLPVNSETYKKFSDDQNANLLLTIKDLFSMNEQLALTRKDDKSFYVYNDINNIKSTMASIIHELNTPSIYNSGLILQLLTVKLFIDISNCNFNNDFQKSGIYNIKKAIIYMKKFFMNNPSNQEIADFVGISVSYLQALLKKEYNKNIHEILTHYKLRHAKYLIENSNLTHEKIAYACGFKTRNELYYAFKKAEHCTPLQYKNSIINKRTRFYSNADEIELT